MYSPFILFITLVIVYHIDGNQILASTTSVNCSIKYGTRLLNEGEKLMIKGKLHKVEECHLQRAYQTCGTHLWFMLNIVCEAIDIHKRRNKLTNHVRRYAQEKLLSEACCDTSCTIAEMTRYCPS